MMPITFAIVRRCGNCNKLVAKGKRRFTCTTCDTLVGPCCKWTDSSLCKTCFAGSH